MGSFDLRAVICSMVPRPSTALLLTAADPPAPEAAAAAAAAAAAVALSVDAAPGVPWKDRGGVLVLASGDGRTERYGHTSVTLVSRRTAQTGGHTVLRVGHEG